MCTSSRVVFATPSQQVVEHRCQKNMEQLSRLLIPRAELAASVRLTVGCERHCGSEIWLCCIGTVTGSRAVREWQQDVNRHS